MEPWRKYFALAALPSRSAAWCYRVTRSGEESLRVLRVLPPTFPGLDEVAQRLGDFDRYRSLVHPHVVGLDEVAEYEEPIKGTTLTYTVEADYDPMGSLRQYVADHEGKVERRQALRWIAQVARALVDMRAAGLDYPDFSPGNIMLLDDEHAALVHPVVAVALEITQGCGSTHAANAASFLAPESASGSLPDDRSLVYTLGCLLFFTLTNRVPRVTADHGPDECGVPDIRVLRPDLKLHVAALLNYALRPEPEQRCPTPADYCADLDAVLAGGAPQRALTAVGDYLRAHPPAQGDGQHPSGAVKTRMMRRTQLYQRRLQHLEGEAITLDEPGGLPLDEEDLALLPQTARQRHRQQALSKQERRRLPPAVILAGMAAAVVLLIGSLVLGMHLSRDAPDRGETAEETRDAGAPEPPPIADDGADDPQPDGDQDREEPDRETADDEGTDAGEQDDETTPVQDTGPDPEAPTVARIVLYDIEAGERHDVLRSGEIFLRTGLPAAVDLRAELDGAGAVRVVCDGEVVDADRPWVPSEGEHTVIATPYAADDASGRPGTPLELTFTVIDTNQPPVVQLAGEVTVAIDAGPVALKAVVRDADGDAIRASWRKRDGPGAVAFTDPAAMETEATFAEPGTYVLALVADDGQATADGTVTVTVTGGDVTALDADGQGPFGGEPRPVPGTIQAEDFDLGGEGVAFHDRDGHNEGDSDYRKGGVDVSGNDQLRVLAWVRDGEWLEYTVEVAEAGQYVLELRNTSDRGGGTMHLEVDGEDLSGPVKLPGTGGWNAYRVTTALGIELPAGRRVLRLVFDKGDSNVDWFRLRPPEPGESLPTGPWITVRRYNLGGEDLPAAAGPTWSGIGAGGAAGLGFDGNPSFARAGGLPEQLAGPVPAALYRRCLYVEKQRSAGFVLRVPDGYYRLVLYYAKRGAKFDVTAAGRSCRSDRTEDYPGRLRSGDAESRCCPGLQADDNRLAVKVHSRGSEVFLAGLALQKQVLVPWEDNDFTAERIAWSAADMRLDPGWPRCLLLDESGTAELIVSLEAGPVGPAGVGAGRGLLLRRGTGEAAWRERTGRGGAWVSARAQGSEAGDGLLCGGDTERASVFAMTMPADGHYRLEGVHLRAKEGGGEARLDVILDGGVQYRVPAGVECGTALPLGELRSGQELALAVVPGASDAVLDPRWRLVKGAPTPPSPVKIAIRGIEVAEDDERFALEIDGALHNERAARVAAVDLFVDGTLVASDAPAKRSPEDRRWSTTEPGLYRLRLRARDEEGRLAWSDPQSVLVGDPVFRALIVRGQANGDRGKNYQKWTREWQRRFAQVRIQAAVKVDRAFRPAEDLVGMHALFLLYNPSLAGKREAVLAFPGPVVCNGGATLEVLRAIKLGQTGRVEQKSLIHRQGTANRSVNLSSDNAPIEWGLLRLPGGQVLTTAGGSNQHAGFWLRPGSRLLDRETIAGGLLFAGFAWKMEKLATSGSEYIRNYAEIVRTAIERSATER